MDKDISEIIDYKKNHGNEDIFYKEIIKKKLINNTKIIKVIDNKDLDVDSPDDYIGVNIFPYYLLPEAQATAQNYVCFETSFKEVATYNKIMKQSQIIFYILCTIKNVFEQHTGIARHDLLAELIIDDFNWCTDFGTELKLVSDKPYAVDNEYVLRTLTFEQITPNNIVSNHMNNSNELNVINQSR